MTNVCLPKLTFPSLVTSPLPQDQGRRQDPDLIPLRHAQRGRPRALHQSSGARGVPVAVTEDAPRASSTRGPRRYQSRGELGCGMSLLANGLITLVAHAATSVYLPSFLPFFLFLFFRSFLLFSLFSFLFFLFRLFFVLFSCFSFVFVPLLFRFLFFHSSATCWETFFERGSLARLPYG